MERILAVDTNAAVHEEHTEEWAKYGIGTQRVNTMNDAISKLVKGDEFLFVVINEDTITDFIKQLPVMRDATELPIFVVTSTYTIDKKIKAMSLGDIWTANYKYGFDYNKLYDLFYLADVPLAEMRVANPYHICGVDALKLYRAIEPNAWSKLVGRVNGANFGAIYGGTKAMGYKDISLPMGHTWKSYAEFLLDTLPEQTSGIYRRKFVTSHYYWLEKGGALPVRTIEELESMGVKMERLGKPQGNRKYSVEYEVVRFHEYPDRIYSKDSRLIPSYKRMCITILKNATSCKYMGFGQTKDELQKQKEAMATWENII